MNVKHVTHTKLQNGIDVNYIHTYKGQIFDRPIAALLILLLFPIFIINSISAIFLGTPPLKSLNKIDALGRHVQLHAFNAGWIKNSGVLFDILLGKLGFCGVPITHRVSQEYQAVILAYYQCKPGLFSLFDLYQSTGLVIQDKEILLTEQLNGRVIDWLMLFCKSAICKMLYSNNNRQLNDSKKIALFGLTIDNVSMEQAIDWVTQSKHHTSTQVGFFINVNSVNLGLNDRTFLRTLKQANTLFADGSGIRLAAKSIGYQLNGNNNGTDMLPILCEQCIALNKTMFFLGSAPGVAEEAAKNLTEQFPGLVISGTQHGFIDHEKTDDVINAINESGCNILLVALGSPLQEKWLIKHKDKLACQTALAVGGLFDFYSGKISRSPHWLRELGMEWVWRLMQEPKAKFKRYVIGNPIFLYKTFILRLAAKGVK